MHIKKLTLENLRGFAGKHEIEFNDPNVAAFIGVNGSGKSTVLEAVVVALHQFVRLKATDPLEPVHNFSQDDVTIGKSQGSIALKIDTRPIGLSDIAISLQIPYSPNLIAEVFFNNLDDTNWLQKAILEKTTLPIFSAYETSLPIHKGGGFFDGTAEKLGRGITYFGAFNSRIDFTTLVEWLEGLVNAQNSKAVKLRNFDYILPAIDTINLGLALFWGELENHDTNAGKVELVIDSFERTLAYVKEDKSLKFDQLSSGEQLAIGLALDVMYRCLSANSHLQSPLNSPGIVLIDEIELHLHPRWQANIVKALTKTFPNIQFIISTHAPLVINQLKDEQLFLLTKDKIIPGTQLQEPYGMAASDVISSLMGVSPRPKEIMAAFESIRQKLDNPTAKNLSEAQQELDALAQKISPNDTEIIQLQTMITFEASEADY